MRTGDTSDITSKKIIKKSLTYSTLSNSRFFVITSFLKSFPDYISGYVLNSDMDLIQRTIQDPIDDAIDGSLYYAVDDTMFIKTEKLNA